MNTNDICIWSVSQDSHIGLPQPLLMVVKVNSASANGCALSKRTYFLPVSALNYIRTATYVPLA